MDTKDFFSLETIIIYCDRIIDTLAGHNQDYEAFKQNLDFQDSCSFRLIQIGEIVNSLSLNFIESHPEMPWRNIIDMRNLLTHEYAKASVAKLWDTLTNDIEPLRAFCAKQIGKE